LFPFKREDFVSSLAVVTFLLTILLVVSVGGSCKIQSVEAQLTNTSSSTELIIKGDSLFNQGKYEEAITYFDKVLALDPNDRDMLYYKGISLEGLGKHEEAITYFDKVLALDQNDTDTLTYKGISLESLGKHEEAITYFDRVLTLDPNNVNTLRWKEYTLHNTGKYDDSVTDLAEHVYPTDTNNTELNDAKDKAKGIIKYVLNTIFPQTGEKFSNTHYGVDMTLPQNWTGFEIKIILPMAIVSPEGFNISSLFSGYIDSVVDNMTDTIISNNASELSDQQFRELFEPKVRESAESLSKNLMEYMLNKTSIMEIAIYDKDLMRLVTSVNPNQTAFVDSLTSLYEQLVASDPTLSCDRKTLNQTVLNNNISAEVSTEECLLVPSNKHTKGLNYLVLTPNAIIGMHYSSDSNIDNDKFVSQFEESVKSLSIEESLPINNQTIQKFVSDDTRNKNDSMLAQNPIDADKDNSLLNQRKYEEAITLYDKALEIDPNDVVALNNKGLALKNLSKYEEAITLYDKALEIDTKEVNVLTNKGVALDDLGRYEEAITWYDKALAVNPMDVDTLFNKGVAFTKLGRYGEAITLYDKALKVDPKFANALFNKGVAFYQLGKIEEAISWFDKALEIEPKAVDALYNKGLALTEVDRYEEAITLYDKALTIDPSYARALTSKGTALYNLGKHEEAITCYDKALTIDPKAVDALINRGAALDTLGKKQEALASLDKALTIDPTNQRALGLKSLIR
jgi:tetratricopeptide (TPR) repeat protein